MLEARLLSEVSTDRAWKTIEDIVYQFPSRLAGTESCWNAAGYVNEQLKAAGVQTELMEYPGLVSFTGKASLEILSPVQRTIPANVLHHSKPTLQPIEADLVDAGTGSWDQCEKAGIAGKIALSDLSYFPPRQEKQRIMALQGALGAVLLSWGYDDSRLLPYGSVKPCWGNPTRLTMRTEMPAIPCLGLSRADGLELRAMVARGPVRLRLSAECRDEWRPLRQAVGRVLPGSGSPEFAILGGHMDSWFGQAASDNAAGNAIFLELARVFQRHAPELRRGLTVGFWVGHETGTMIGSSHFVDRCWDDLRENAVAYLQIDQPALVGTTLWETKSDVELHDFHAAVERRVLGGMSAYWGRLVRTGDTSFFGVGVPSLTGRTAFTKAEVSAMGNGNLGWWHHTDASTIERLDKELLGLHLKVYVAYLAELLTVPVIPARFTPTVKQMVERVETLLPIGDEIGLSRAASLAREALDAVQRLDTVAESWRERARRTEAPEEVVAALNTTLKALSRILVPLGGTVAGSYGHDPYGLSAQSTLLPGLYELPRMNSLGAGSEERHLLATELIRQRNRFADGMREVRDLARRTVAVAGL